MARRGRRSGIIRVLVRATRGRVVLHPRTRGSATSIAIAFIVVPAEGDGRPLTVVIPGTVSTGCREPSVVFIHGRVGPARGTRPVWVTVGTLFNGLDLEEMRRGSSCEFRVGLGPYIRNASHARALEIALVQLLHGGLQVVGGFEFNKPCFRVNGDWNKNPGSDLGCNGYPPSSLFTASFRVDHVQSGLTSKVFEVLENEW